MEEDRIRVEALKLAIKSYGEDVKNKYTSSIEYRANEFFNYITTGNTSGQE